MDVVNNILAYSEDIFSLVKREIRRKETHKEIENEIKAFLTLCLLPGLLITILVCINWDTMVISWLVVMFLTRRINKTELVETQKEQNSGLDKIHLIHQSRKIWIKIASLLLLLIAVSTLKSLSNSLFQRIFYQTQLQVSRKHSNTNPERPLFTLFPLPVENLVFDSIFKWFSFIQYFSFYRAYLYFFMALGSFIAPKLAGSLPDTKTDEKTEASHSDKKTD